MRELLAQTTRGLARQALDAGPLVEDTRRTNHPLLNAPASAKRPTAEQPQALTTGSRPACPAFTHKDSLSSSNTSPEQPSNHSDNCNTELHNSKMIAKGLGHVLQRGLRAALT